MAGAAGVAHGVAVSSGTAGLHLIVRALGIGPGAEVLVPSFTFVASLNAILYEGATPVFVDIDPDTYTVDPACIDARRSPKTKAAMAVDVFGHPADWAEIGRVASDLAVIDDAVEAVGAGSEDPSAASVLLACFSFYPNKRITTGDVGWSPRTMKRSRSDVGVFAIRVTRDGALASPPPPSIQPTDGRVVGRPRHLTDGPLAYLPGQAGGGGGDVHGAAFFRSTGCAVRLSGTMSR